jgi:hypothetical protein
VGELVRKEQKGGLFAVTLLFHDLTLKATRPLGVKQQKNERGRAKKGSRRALILDLYLAKKESIFRSRERGF